ncbi:nucleoside 2-deoxyribosyltransferase [Bacillus wiedmannii]|uniref:nucleoside 2-deoxyribosyltransferase n=1 Tax=Bacillus wiedmannii TaxID=1890302 RepID=UPI000BFE673D|nr:nucleoside 2-deoxyribosyltransferase [Bacillus wiedmannii]PHE70559.1 nucleoside 2-deoxyribosyltransferase [Bacillus wiedmannii]
MTQTTKTLASSKKHHCYVAAPFFNPDQITRVALVETLLEKHGFTYFSPRKELVCPPNATDQQRKETFEGNENGIKDAEFLVAITDGKDMGTIWEAGVAYALGIPVIYVAFTLGKDGMFNLMLAESGVAACKTVEELERAILGENIRFEGFIE